MVTLVVRLQEFLRHKGIGIMELSNALNYSSPQKLYRLFNTENAWPSCQIIQDISGLYEELNLNWLFTGSGPMLIEGEKNIDYKDKYFNCLEEKSWIAVKCLEEKEKYELLQLKISGMNR